MTKTRASNELTHAARHSDECPVPVYQTFGGGNWVDDGGSRYTLPTVSRLEQIMARWDARRL